MRGAMLFFFCLVAMAAGCTTPQGGAAPPPAFVGVWHQNEAECGAAEPVRELVFEADNRFSATWLPFEVYKDYWGTWRYDASTHVLTLAVENGNHVPSDLVLSGEVSADAHQLTLGAISLGSPSHGARCMAPFRR
jgi:hypothetical protein